MAKTPSADFQTWSLMDADDALPDLPDAEANRPFIEGDHFQRGDAWVGPGPKAGNDQYNDFIALLEPAFVSSNLMLETADRRRDGVVGREPASAWVPMRTNLEQVPLTDQEQQDLADLETATSIWWDQRKFHSLIKRLCLHLLWAKEAGWRLLVPSGLLDSEGRLRVSTLLEAFMVIYLDVPDPEAVTVYEHPDTRQRCGVYVYQDTNGQRGAELSFLDIDNTVLKVLPSGEASVLPLSGHLTIGNVTLDRAMFQASERSIQMALNMTLTLLAKGEVDNAFLERFFTNALPPGQWTYKDDGQGNRVRDKYEVAPRVTGGATDSYLQGIDYQNESGNTVLTNPGVVFRDPTDPTSLIKSGDYWYIRFLQAVHQAHILSNQQTTPSGASREQTRDDFIKSTRDPQNEMESAGAEILMSLVALAEALINRPGYYTNRYRIQFTCRPDYGPLSMEERQEYVAEAEKGYISDETAMAALNVDDVVAELARIAKQPRAQLALSEKQATVATLWETMFPREVALMLAGLSEEKIKEIMDATSKAIADDPNADPKNPPPAPTPDPNADPTQQ